MRIDSAKKIGNRINHKLKSETDMTFETVMEDLNSIIYSNFDSKSGGKKGYSCETVGSDTIIISNDNKPSVIEVKLDMVDPETPALRINVADYGNRDFKKMFALDYVWSKSPKTALEKTIRLIEKYSENY